MLQNSQMPSTIAEGYESSIDERSDDVVDNEESDEVISS